MIDINKKITEVKSVTEKFNKGLSLEAEILGVHEALTKLWTVSVNDSKNKEELGRRLSNVLIGVLLLSDKFGIKNLEDDFQKRLEDLKKEVD